MRSIIQSRIMVLLIDDEPHVCYQCKSIGLFNIVDYRHETHFNDFEFSSEVRCMNCKAVNYLPLVWKGIIGILSLKEKV